MLDSEKRFRCALLFSISHTTRDSSLVSQIPDTGGNHFPGRTTHS